MANHQNNIIPIRSTKPVPSDNRFKFTNNRIKRIQNSVKGNQYFYDTEVTGLCLRVTPTGAKTYVLYRRINGKPIRYTLGRINTITLAGARSAAQQLNGQLAAGIDIVQKRNKSRMKHITVGKLFSIWLQSAKSRKLRRWHDDEKLWELHLKSKLQNKEAKYLTTMNLQKLVDRIAAKHPRTANKVTALLSRVFNTAIKKGYFSGNNPARFVDRQPENSRERFLRPDEIPKFLQAVDEEPSPWREFFLLLLFTGARRSTVASMRWQDVDFIDQIWHIPCWASKNGKSMCIPLTPEAMQILNSLKPTLINDWVLPSSLSASGHVETPIKPWKRVCKKAGLKDLRIHDLRRTVGSWLAASGASNFIISKALGHISLKSAEVYARLDTKPVRNSLTEITKKWQRK